VIEDNITADNSVTPKGVLWDLDGVLVDTGEIHYQSWLAILVDYGIEYDRPTWERTFGMNNDGTLRELTGGKLAPEVAVEIIERKEQLFRERVRGLAEPLPGVVAWLSRLKEHGYRQGIASSAPQANIDVLIGRLGISSYFDVIVSGAEMPPKPDPAVFFRVAEQIGVLPERCVVVEDSRAGVEAARRGGMHCIAVTTTNPPEALQTADVIVDRLDELPSDVFERLLRMGR
jgi:HAD superfamily hydrolase (TIGR01509 family)